MGSLTKKPNLPTIPQTTQTVTSTSTGSGNTGSSIIPSASSEDTPTPAEAKSESLLRRSRGRLSTVFTGFRGLLTEANQLQGNSAGRKTLLGE